MACPSCCSCHGMKAVVWVFWCFNTFFGVIYSGLALASFSAVRSGTEHFEMDSETQKATYRNSLLASCMLGFLMVLFFMVYSFLVLIWRQFGDAKLAYGIMLGTAIHTAWFMILAGLVLQNRDGDMELLKNAGWWSDGDYKTYQATYIFSYILSGLYIIAFLILLLGRTYLGKPDEGPAAASGLSRTSTQPVNVYVDMGSFNGAKQPSMARPNQV